VEEAGAESGVSGENRAVQHLHAPNNGAAPFTQASPHALQIRMGLKQKPLIK